MPVVPIAIPVAVNTVSTIFPAAPTVDHVVLPTVAIMYWVPISKSAADTNVAPTLAQLLVPKLVISYVRPTIKSAEVLVNVIVSSVGGSGGPGTITPCTCV